MAKLPAKNRQIPWIVQSFSKILIRLLGWQIVGEFKGMEKALMISQHTSNWDGIFAIFGTFSLGIRPRWLAKDKLFKGILGPIMRWAGGIEIDRSKNANVVEQVTAQFAKEEQLWLFVAPEGTRKKAEYWRTGFYYIALNTQVSIVKGIIDYKYKQVGIADQMMPSGDIEADLDIFRAWYADHHPKYPENAAPIQLRSKDED